MKFVGNRRASIETDEVRGNARPIQPTINQVRIAVQARFRYFFVSWAGLGLCRSSVYYCYYVFPIQPNVVSREHHLPYIDYIIKKNEEYTSAVRSTRNVFLLKTQLCKVRVILRSRMYVTKCVYPREGYRSVTPLLMPGSTGLRHSALFCARKLYNPH